MLLALNTFTTLYEVYTMNEQANQQVTPAQAALNILAKAAEIYLSGLDPLAQALAAPQFTQAIQILAAQVTPVPGSINAPNGGE